MATAPHEVLFRYKKINTRNRKINSYSGSFLLYHVEIIEIHSYDAS